MEVFRPKQISVKFSARNTISGKVTHLKLSPVRAEVAINVAFGFDVVSVIGTTSAEDLQLKVGSSAFAVINASSVVVDVDHASTNPRDPPCRTRHRTRRERHASMRPTGRSLAALISLGGSAAFDTSACTGRRLRIHSEGAGTGMTGRRVPVLRVDRPTYANSTDSPSNFSFPCACSLAACDLFAVILVASLPLGHPDPSLLLDLERMSATRKGGVRPLT
jgi:molybdate transport system regulatory protein